MEHHHKTQHGFDGPDCFGPERLYHHSVWLRRLEKFTPGSGTKRSYLFLFFGSLYHTARVAFTQPQLFRTSRERLKIRAFVIATQLLWEIAAELAMPYSMFYLMLVPLAVSNFIMMSYVATNHFISPMTEHTNDALVNSLTVRSNAIIERFHLFNNFHVEHHVLPYVNPVHARLVASHLKRLWPDKYQEMGHIEALQRVSKRPRVYRNETTLINPRTERTARTLPAHYLGD